MAGVRILVLATHVVQEREQFHDTRVRTGDFREAQPVGADARPVGRAVERLPVEGRVLAQVGDEGFG